MPPREPATGASKIGTLAAATALSLSFAFGVTSCAATGASSVRRRPAAPQPGDPERIDQTRALLQSLRLEVTAFLDGLPAGADPDGLPLLRRDGRLFYWGLHDDLPEQDVAWVTDAWGDPLVIVRSEEDPDDWCILSAGPDAEWTSGSAVSLPLPARPGPDPEKGEAPDPNALYGFAEQAPHYYGVADALHRRVLGDDIVLHATGLFFQRYPFDVPTPAQVIASLASLLKGRPSGPLPVEPELAEEVDSMSQERREAIARFLEVDKEGFSFCEDVWSHECVRKDGLLPLLYLCHATRYAGDPPPFWIQAEEEGWVVDWSAEDAAEIVSRSGS